MSRAEQPQIQRLTFREHQAPTVTHIRCRLEHLHEKFSFRACSGESGGPYAKKGELPTCPACCVIWDIMKEGEHPSHHVEAIPMEIRSRWPKWEEDLRRAKRGA